MRQIAILSTLAFVVGCGNPAIDNPDFMGMSVSDGVITGSYNPAGFISDEVRKSAAQSCSGGALDTFVETADANGLISFTATCTNGTAIPSGAVEIQR